MFLAAGCGGGGDKKAAPAAGKAEEKVLTVYSARSESLNNAVIKNFEKDTGIKVNVVIAGTGEVVKRVKSEKTIRWAMCSGQAAKLCWPAPRICSCLILPRKMTR
jgi:ABC-type molybdate transport system substrate-binding protein